ncbi:MAG: ABC transporter substrate-binding protein [Patescibacteria group bacterium]
MKTYAKILLGLLIIAGIAIVILRSTPAPKQGQVTEIKIGAVYTLTGIISDIGKALQEGSELAKEQINSRGGINGKSITIIYEDDPDYNPIKAVSAAQKLINVDRVSAVMDMAYTGLAAMRPIAEEKRVPIIDVLDASDQISTFGDWIFGSGIYDDGVGTQVAQFASKELGVQRAALLVGKDEYLQAVAGGFSQEFTRSGGTITLHEEFTVGDADFRTQLLKIINSGAQTIFVSHLGEGGLIAKQATELGYKGTFLGSDPWSLGDVVNVAGSSLDNRTYFGLWRNFDEQTDAQKMVVEQYKQKYNKDPGDYLFYISLGYDGVMTLADAIKKSDGSSEGIQKALYSVKNLQGLSGEITIDPSGINRDPKSAIVMYKDGAIVRYKK